MDILFIGFVDISLNKGNSVHTRELVENLRKRGNRVKLIAQASKKIAFHDFHNTTPFLNHKSEISRFFYLLVSIVKAFFYILIYAKGATIIYVRDSISGMLATVPKMLYKKKMVYEVNGLASEERRLYGRYLLNRLYIKFLELIERIAIKNSDRIIAVTWKIKEYIVKRYGVDNYKIEVIGNGVNTNLFFPIQDNGLLGGLKRGLGIEEGDYVISFVGSLSPWQGIEYLIKASPYVIKEIPNTKFLIVGDGLKRRELEDMVKGIGLERSFIFTGEISYKEVPLYINISDICSTFELFLDRLNIYGSPVKIFEYMACSKPILCLKVPELGFIEENEVGFLAEDPISISEKIILLLKDEELRKRFGENGVRIASENTWERISERIEGLLSSWIKS